MPTYSFHNKETGETWDDLMSWDERVEFLESNPHVEALLTGALNIGDAVRLGFVKRDGAFTDRLKEIKSKHRGSTIDV
jgi:hypothetical protein